MEIIQDKVKDRNLDFVICFDVTGAMSDFIYRFNRGFEDFVHKIIEGANENHTNVTGLRFRFIQFRNYHYDEDPMNESVFFEWPIDRNAIHAYLDKIEVHGKANQPHNGLEAIYKAIRSQFVTGKFDRQIIILFTDSEAVPVGEYKDDPTFPDNMITTLDKLEDEWCCMSGDTYLRERCKRLMLFAPEKTYYSEMLWNRMMFFPVKAGEGLNEFSIEDIAGSMFQWTIYTI